MRCSWPTNGGAVALRNGDEDFGAPKLLQKGELARQVPVFHCRTAEGTLLSVRRMPVENRNASDLKRLKLFFFFKRPLRQQGWLKYAADSIIFTF